MIAAQEHAHYIDGALDITYFSIEEFCECIANCISYGYSPVSINIIRSLYTYCNDEVSMLYCLAGIALNAYLQVSTLSEILYVITERLIHSLKFVAIISRQLYPSSTDPVAKQLEEYTRYGMAFVLKQYGVWN